MTVSEYAQIKGVSTQAVSNHLKRYKKELSEHVIKRGRSRVLDEYAVDFLNQKVIGSRVTIYDGTKDEEIRQLREEVNQLQQQLIDVQQDFLQEKDRTRTLEMEKLQIEGDKQQEANEKEREKAAREQAEKKLRQLQQRRLTIRERFLGRLDATDIED